MICICQIVPIARDLSLTQAVQYTLTLWFWVRSCRNLYWGPVLTAMGAKALFYRALLLHF